MSRNLYNKLKTALINIFNLSPTTGIFPDRMKVAKVALIFKNVEKFSISNYKPLSVFPCFSKILEQITCNRLFDYLIVNDIFFNKEFGFRAGHSTKHAFLKIWDSFNDKNYFLGIFIDLSKDFGNVDHSMLRKKL